MSDLVFGPVPSRRLGRSLGINSIPHKVCSYACVYCQVGRTAELTAERREFLPPARLAREVEQRLRDLRSRREPVDYLAFVPDGEPTLDSRLGEAIEALRPLGVPMAVLSNASLVDRGDVQDDLLRADWVSLKVDAVRPEAWHQVNRPHGRLRLEDVLRGGLRFARRFRGTLATETMLVSGVNDSEADVEAAARYLEALGPEVAYLSVPTRPPAEAWVRPPGDEVVLRAFQQLSEQLPGTRVELLVADEGNAFASTGDARADLLSITAVHPMREEAVADLLARSGAGGSVVDDLVAEGRLVRREHGGHAFLVRRFGRLRALAFAAAAFALAAAGCSRTADVVRPLRRAPQRVFLVGFDGMDPTLARKWMAEGKLPNLSRLAEEGAFVPLQTTQPSESPTAWASFATGVNPGKHNIFDFLVRDFETYMPDLAMVRREPAEFLWGLVPTRKPKVESTRGGTSFWVHAGRDGIRSVVLTVPVTFPVEGVHHSDLLAGFPLPDIRGTVGTFSYWATDLSPAEAGNTEFGGILERLLFEDGVASTVLVGPDDPLVAKGEPRRRLTVPLEVRWAEGASRVDLDLAGEEVRLAAGEWSDWIPVTFKVTPLVRVRGMVQLHVVRADRELQLYASPVNIDPRRPVLPISSPEAFAPRLVDEVGLYRTLGWAEATWPLNEGRLDEAAFMADCDRAFADRERIFTRGLERDDWDLYLAVVETTDRVQHMMWRFIDPRHPMHDPALAVRWGDAIERTYRKCDDLVGRMRAKLPKDAVVFVMSDHGFHSFRRSVNLNSWLAQNGYLVFTGQGEGGERRLDDLFGRGRFWEGVDWGRTRAYALGLGQIYFNLRGRESRGIVSAGAEYAALQDEIVEKLSPLVDPETGERVFGGIYRRDELYHGQYLVNAPDLQAGFADGYRVGWQDTLGGIRPTVIENNTKRWSGDHCGTAREWSAGVLFTNRRLAREDPHILDIAPTILKLLEVPLPEDLDGRPFL